MFRYGYTDIKDLLFLLYVCVRVRAAHCLKIKIEPSNSTRK